MEVDQPLTHILHTARLYPHYPTLPIQEEPTYTRNIQDAPPLLTHTQKSYGNTHKNQNTIEYTSKSQLAITDGNASTTNTQQQALITTTEQQDRQKRKERAEYKEETHLLQLPERKHTRREKAEWHAPWKLLRVIAGHMGWVRSVTVDCTNEWFCTGAGDRIIKVRGML